MATETIHTATQPHCTIVGGRGDIQVVVGDGRTFAIESAVPVVVARRANETYVVQDHAHGLRLQLPHDATIHVRDHKGAIVIRGIAHVVLETTVGDATITEIAGTVTVTDLTGDLDVSNCAALSVSDSSRRYRSDTQRGVEDATLRAVGHVDIENVGRTLSMTDTQHAKIGNVGAHCRIADVAGGVRIVNVGGTCTIERVGGALVVGNVGGNATFSTVGRIERLGNVGGTLRTTAAPLAVPAPSPPMHIAVGGDALLELPDGIDATIEAMVGGAVRGAGLALSGPGMHRIVYGAGTAHLHIVAGGDIELRGGGMPQATGSSWGQWARFGADLGRSVASTIANGVAAAYQAHEVEPHQRPTVPLRPDTDPRAILQMVAEGSIAPAEADTMLAALEK